MWPNHCWAREMYTMFLGVIQINAAQLLPLEWGVGGRGGVTQGWLRYTYLKKGQFFSKKDIFSSIENSFKSDEHFHPWIFISQEWPPSSPGNISQKWPPLPPETYHRSDPLFPGNISQKWPPSSPRKHITEVTPLFPPETYHRSDPPLPPGNISQKWPPLPRKHITEVTPSSPGKHITGVTPLFPRKHITGVTPLFPRKHITGVTPPPGKISQEWPPLPPETYHRSDPPPEKYHRSDPLFPRKLPCIQWGGPLNRHEVHEKWPVWYFSFQLAFSRCKLDNRENLRCIPRSRASRRIPHKPVLSPDGRFQNYFLQIIHIVHH